MRSQRLVITSSVNLWAWRQIHHCGPLSYTFPRTKGHKKELLVQLCTLHPACKGRWMYMVRQKHLTV